jgi:hypothetical protein
VWSSDADERPGEQLFPYEMWERQRPWRQDAGAPAPAPAADTPPEGELDEAP